MLASFGEPLVGKPKFGALVYIRLLSQVTNSLNFFCHTQSLYGGEAHTGSDSRVVDGTDRLEAGRGALQRRRVVLCANTKDK